MCVDVVAALIRKSLCLLLLISLPQAAFAHVLQSEGDIGVLMHVDPGDEPVAGEQATLMLEMTAKKGRFAIADCDCRLRILSEANVVFEAPIAAGTGGTAAVPFVFAAAGMYRAEIAGSPRTGAPFRPFHVGFDVRVVPGEAADESPWSWLRRNWVVSAAVLLTLIGCAYAAFGRKNGDDNVE